ncbi:unnamed protein product [Medioppia subpectinata]|uniref:Secreted protein n=1 Tax=Medioppia subpectinata TaxID=1979941 RepID=A0A7R9KJU4_9ACAR|nr:unnamed protein product [Medioppia subpectinata]CAG2104863.1 unnamed protein product [Medioppia subpectinata]
MRTLYYQSLHILALVPSLPAQTTHSETTEIMPEFEGQIVIERTVKARGWQRCHTVVSGQESGKI